MRTKGTFVKPAHGLVCAMLGVVAASLIAASLIAISLAALLPMPAQAAGFPERPIRIIVPFAPGGASDLIARVISGPLQQELGQSVIVENRPGANGNIGIGFVANAEPDGYTLLVASSVIFVNKPLQRPNSFDPATDFAPIADLGGSPDDASTDNFQGIFAPAGTPRPIIDRLAKALAEILARPDVKEKYVKIGLPVVAEGPAAFRARVEHEVPMYKEIIEKGGLKIN